MNSPEVAYFGYGSLVNRQTLSGNKKAVPTQVSGWIREWKHCVNLSLGKICALTVSRRPGTKIHGVLILDSMVGLAEIDRREIGYSRENIEIEDATLRARLEDVPAYTYVSTGEFNHWGNAEYPIWQSYLDCVLMGYIEVWGRKGAADFIATTEGWNQVPILNDRTAPKYPRAIDLSETNRRVIDDLLEEAGVSRSAT